MKIKNSRSMLALVAVCSLLLSSMTQAATVVTPATGGTCLNLAPGAYKVLSNITISEAVVGDMAIQAGTTFILTAPAGFEFNPGVGNVVFTGGRDIASASISVTNTTITVTLNIPTNTNLDILRIRNIEVRSLVPYSTGNITRTVAGGTATMTGNAPGAGVNHGSLTTTGTGASVTTVSNGNWSSPGTWTSGFVPSCTDNVIIGHQVNVDAAVGVNNLTINTGGNLISDNAVTVDGTFQMNGTAIYTHNNTTTASTTIFKGTESFASTSRIIISRWSNFTVPLPTGVTGDFGAIEINTTGNWNQAGLFAPARIKGALTINNGVITMDNGTGMTTDLTLQDVTINGPGRFIAQSGAPRNLTLTTGNFTDNSTATGYSYIVFRSVGVLDWNVNGNLTINHRFMVMEGVSTLDVGTTDIHVTGDLSIGNGTFFGMRNATGDVIVNVDGNTSISGTPTLVSFKENFDGNLTFTSANMSVSAGINNYFMRGNSCTGTVTVGITGNLAITGNTTRLHLATSNTNTSLISLNVGNDMVLTGGQLFTSTTLGPVNINIVRNYTQTGATSIFYGQRTAAASGAVNMVVSGTLSVSDGLFSQSQGLGTIDLDVVETLMIQNAVFYGMNNTTAGNNGSASLSVTDLDINGSTFMLHRGEITDGRVITVDIADQMTINFTSTTQQVFFINRASNNNAQLNLNIGSNFYSIGTANGLFCSSMSEGAETITIGGDLSVSAGRVRFNAYEGVTARGHLVTGTVGGSLMVSGGSIALSSNRGVLNWTVAGDYDQTGGYAVYKWFTGAGTINVGGNYNLNNASVHMHSRPSTATPDAITLSIAGNATFENATTVFDSCQTSTGTHRMIFNGANVTFGSNVIFTHAGHLTTRTVFGSMIYDRAGIITLRRNTASFDIRQVKQTVTAGTTVDFTTSPFDLMVASHVSTNPVVHTTLDINGTLDMGSLLIAARDQAGYYSSLNVNNGGRLRTTNTNGLYSGTAAASTVYPQIAGSYRMNYFLHANSTVEYYGSDTQVVTGTGAGLATTNDHRYGNLEINFQGTPDVEFAYPADNNVFVRTALVLTAGEFNLDDDHIAASGGRTLNLMNGATLSRVNGYLRSEVEDGTGALSWNITTTGSFVVPFGYNASEYIPFTYQPTSGSSGDVLLATYHVAVDNTPFPPTVTHVRDVGGADNSNFTVDRFWRIVVPGNVTASLTFSSTTAERSGIVNPRAQLWEPVTQGWYPPSGIQSNPTVSTTLAGGVTALNNWWTLSSAASPLPVELVAFSAVIENNEQVRLSWTTASETNNDFFTIERSHDGENFAALIEVDGAGTSNSVIDYKVYDTAPFNGLNYYRLKQTDFDGLHAYSDIRMVTFRKNTPVTVYPNPVMGNVVSVSTDNISDAITTIHIYDLAGKLVSRYNGFGNSTNKSLTQINLGNNLEQGTYLMEVSTATGIYRERIVKQ